MEDADLYGHRLRTGNTLETEGPGRGGGRKSGGLLEKLAAALLDAHVASSVSGFMSARLADRRRLRFPRQHRAPAGHFRLEEFAELFGRAVLRDTAHVGEAFAQIRVRERGADFGVQLLHDRARRAGGREHAAPTRAVVAGHPAFGSPR